MNKPHDEDYTDRINRIQKSISLRRDKLSGVNSPKKISIIKEEINKYEKQKANLIKRREKWIQDYPEYLVNHIIYKRNNNITVTYDYLNDIIPPHIISADLIEQIIERLKENNIDVIESVKKNPEIKYHSLVDGEMARYAQDIENQLNELLLKGAEDKSENEGKGLEQNKNKVVNSLKNIHSKISDLKERINLPPLPQLNAIKPKLVRDNDSLLISSQRVKPRKSFFLSNVKNIESNILSEEETNTETDSSEYRGPKIFSQQRFDNDRRLSLFAKTVGDRGEEIVIKFLKETLLPCEKSTIRWVAKTGETPGWDIAYLNSDNQLVAIEVKGTTGNSFPNVQITGNEWDAANLLQENYWIYLVTDCFGINPQIQCLQNPVKLKESGILHVTPILWRVEMISQ